ncbi:hypothetical protein LOK74_05910 [Brevibacillus humidisoli]|uniref:hypothetical protein n=1 Tax=Brevibacillus humidisoli TaxID=2895522 RepID=UPI001E5F1A79|nr:hypothetical protein [Brevibacillus humidisoli]UFJ42033.1 hypothetical protein LOK74_05910 [Brevibacillus humidisoli]
MTRKKQPVKKRMEIERSKREWIDTGAASLKAERFEIAGALFAESDDKLLSETVVRQKLKEYKGGGK